MTDDTIRAVLDRYETRLRELHRLFTGGVQHDVGEKQQALVAHLQTMIPKMREMLQRIELQAIPPHDDLNLERRVALEREKLMRWLGFLQGAFWVLGIYTIDEMRAHNMPTGEGVS